MKKSLSIVKKGLSCTILTQRWPKTFISLVLFCALATVTLGQTQVWHKTYPDLPANVSAMVATPDGGYLVLTGRFLIQMDSAGNQTSITAYDISAALITTSDGGYLLGGTYGNDYKIIKFDASGEFPFNKVWEKTYGGTSTDSLKSLVATSDGGYLLGGTSSSGISGDKTQSSRGGKDYWVVKVNSEGTKVWDKTFGGSADDTFKELVATLDGGCVLAGTSMSDRSGDKTENRRGRYDEGGEYHSGSDYWLVRMNSNGAKVWDRTYGGSGDEEVRAIVATHDGGFIVGGRYGNYIYNEETGNFSVDGDRTAPLNSDRDDIWILKMDANGEKLWDNATGEYEEVPVLADIIAMPDGTYMLAYTNDTAGESYYGWMNTHYQFITIKMNNDDGSFIGGYSSSRHEGSENIVYTLVTTTNGYLVVGLAFSYVYYGVYEDEDFYEDFITGADKLFLAKIEELLPVVVTANFRFGGSGTDRFTQVINTNDGGFLSAGVSDSGLSGDKTQSSRGGYDLWVVKTTAAGTKQWDKRFGGTGTESLNSIIRTSDGGYLLGGSSTSGMGGDKTQSSRGGTDYWLVKISGTGEKQWDRRFGGSGYDYLNKVIQLASGEYILAGVSDSPVSGDKTQSGQGGRDQWVLKISSTGVKIWDKRFGGALNEYVEGLVTTPDGGFVIGGYSASGIGGDKVQTSRGGYDYWLVKVNGSGAKVWDRRFGGSLDDKLSSLIRTSDGGYLLGGYSVSGNSGDKKQANKGGNDYWVVKVDANGTKVWDKSFGGLRDDKLTSILPTADGGYLLGGNSLSLASFDKTEPILGSTDFWLVKIDGSGTKLFDQRFGGTGTDEMRTILATPDGNYLLGGQSTSGVSGTKTESSRGGTDMWLVKVGLSPDQATDAVMAIAKPSAPIMEKAITEEPVALKEWKATTYPNPFRERVTVNFTLPETQPVSVKIYDLQGREVANLYQKETPANQACAVEWRPTGNQAAGVYILRVSTAYHTSQQKIILTK